MDEQGGTSRRLLNATDRTIDSMINTTLIFIGGRCIEGTTAAKSIRVELDYVRMCWRESEGPDEKASCYTVSRYAGTDVIYLHMTPRSQTRLRSTLTSDWPVRSRVPR
jgi:hypothetical protein